MDTVTHIMDPYGTVNPNDPEEMLINNNTRWMSLCEKVDVSNRRYNFVEWLSNVAYYFGLLEDKPMCSACAIQTDIDDYYYQAAPCSTCGGLVIVDIGVMGKDPIMCDMCRTVARRRAK
jgi:hypothetical protein